MGWSGFNSIVKVGSEAKYSGQCAQPNQPSLNVSAIGLAGEGTTNETKTEMAGDCSRHLAAEIRHEPGGHSLLPRTFTSTHRSWQAASIRRTFRAADAV